MRPLDIDYATLTLTLPFPKDDLLRVQLALTHQAKNLYNTGLFLVRQVFSAYEYDKASKLNLRKNNDDLKPVQIQVIDFFNQQIGRINDKRTLKHPEQCAKALTAGKDAPKLKLVPALTPCTETLVASLLDATVLDNVARHWKNETGDSVYKRLPGVMAQQVTKKLAENFKSFFVATQRFNANPKDMTGRPRMPSYLGKNERFVLEIPLAQIHGGFPPLKDKVVPEDYRETSLLPPDVLAAFSDFDVAAVVDVACKKRGWKDYQAQHLRIVPMRNSVKMEVIVRVKNAYPPGSFLDTLTKTHGAQISDLKTQKKRDDWLLQHLQAIQIECLPRVASMDLGVNNLVTVAYSTGRKAAVHDGGRFEAVLTQMGQQIDARISAITPDRAKELQGKKNALSKDNQQLAKAEHIELNSLLKTVYEDAEYRRLMAKKNRWISDYLHKTSSSLVQQCQERGIEVIVLGRNKGWKQEVEMGRVQNRRFCQVAHATLVTMITYKAQALGMAVVSTEESYTSKTSFVNGDVLESFEEKQTAKNEAINTGIEIPAALKTGYRSSNNRNWFVHKNRDDRWKRVHADVNGAFNILRKVFASFRYHVGLTLKFTLYRLSPWQGLVALKL
jgi:putative transposase